MTGMSMNTALKLLGDAGKAFLEFQDTTLVNLNCQRLQADEIWSFVGMKQKNVPAEKKARVDLGDVWTWTVIDADTKLVPCWLVGPRDSASAYFLMKDLESRLRNKVQLTTDGLKLYATAIEQRFGRGGIDYGIIQKHYGTDAQAETRYSPAVCIGCEKEEVFGSPDQAHISTSYVERQNLSMRMGMRRFTRLTNAFSKKFENHVYAISIYFMNYNFVRIHQTLRTTPAMAANVVTKLWDLGDLLDVLEGWESRQPRTKVGRKPGQKTGQRFLESN
jgi:IS1 family transposase